jgi:hypothetical protein
MRQLLLSTAALMMLALPSALAAPAGFGYLTGDADIIVHFDSQRLQKSQTFKDLMAMAMANPKAKAGLDEIKAKSGIDVLKDVDSLTVQIKSPAPGASRATVLGFVQGRFNPATLLKAMKAEKNEVTEEKTPWGVVYTNGKKDEAVGFTFLKGGVLFGDVDLIKSHKKNKFKGPLSKFMSSFKAQGQDVWVASKFSPEMRNDFKTKNPMMAQFVQVVGSLDFAPGLHLSVRATGENAAGPKQIATMAQAQLAASTQAPQAAMFAGMINKITVKAEGNDLVVDVPLNQQDVNQIKMMVGMMLMSLQGGGGPAGAPPGSAPKIAK